MYEILKDGVRYDEFETYEAAKTALPFHMTDHPSAAFAVRRFDERSGMFRDHSCWKCLDGKKSCVVSNPRD